MSSLRRSFVVYAVPALLVLAGCGDGGSTDDTGATGDPVPGEPADSVTTGDGVPAAPATDPVTPGARPNVELPVILARSADRAPDGGLRLLNDLPPAPDTTRTPVENRHDPSRTDTVMTLAWEALELEVYHVSSSGKEILRTVRVSSGSYATNDGLAVGITRDSVRALRGEPARTEAGDWIYEVYDGPNDPTATLLRVSFEADRVAGLRWSFYID